MHKNKISLSLALLLLLCLAWLAHMWLATDKHEHQEETVTVVQTTRAKVQAMPEVFKTIAVLSAKQTVLITNEVIGRVKSMLVSDGTYVTAGTPLVALLPEFVIRAPIDGYLTDWKVTEGAFLKQGTVLNSVINRQQLAVEYYVPEQYLAKLQLNHPVEIKVRAYADKVFSGKVVFIAPQVELKNHSILIRAELDNTDGKLLPGLFSEVTHIFNPNPSALVIMESCLVAGMEGYQVYKVVAKKAVKQDVIVGQRDNGLVQILSGLQAGDEVIVTQPPGLRDGMDVSPKLLT